ERHVLQKRDVQPGADVPARAVVALRLGIEHRAVGADEGRRVQRIAVGPRHELAVAGRRAEAIGPEVEPRARREADEIVERDRGPETGIAEKRVAAVGTAAPAKVEEQRHVERIDADELELRAGGDVGELEERAYLDARVESQHALRPRAGGGAEIEEIRIADRNVGGERAGAHRAPTNAALAPVPPQELRA